MNRQSRFSLISAIISKKNRIHVQRLCCGNLPVICILEKVTGLRIYWKGWIHPDLAGPTKKHYLVLQSTSRSPEVISYHPDPLLQAKDSIKELYESLAPASSFFFPSVEDSLYHILYTSYLRKEKERVWEIGDMFQTDHFFSVWRPAVLYLEALTYAAGKDTANCREKLHQLATLFPVSPLADIATRFLENLEQNNELTGDFVPLGLSYAHLLPVKTYSFVSSIEETDYRLILFMPDQTFPDQEIIYKVYSFNFTFLVRKQLDVEIRYWGEQRGVVISGFTDSREISTYLTLLRQFPLFPEVDPEPEYLPVSGHNYQLLRTEQYLNDYRAFYLSKETGPFTGRHK